MLDARLTWYLAIGNLMSWGRAQTEKQAIANMHREARSWRTGGKRTDEYVVWLASEATEVDGMGGIRWPAGDPKPVKIKHVKPKVKA